MFHGAMVEFAQMDDRTTSTVFRNGLSVTCLLQVAPPPLADLYAPRHGLLVAVIAVAAPHILMVAHTITKCSVFLCQYESNVSGPVIKIRLVKASCKQATRFDFFRRRGEIEEIIVQNLSR
jgi:hypothetical protein